MEGGTEGASWKSDIRVILNMTNIGEYRGF